jgi:Tfp pilus assembly PilM family ATPase
MARVVAIDLGASAVKVTILEGSGRTAKVVDRFSQPVPQEDGATVPPLGERIAVLAELVKARPAMATANAVAVTWPTEQATLHRVNLPFTDPAQVAKTLPFTLEAIVPFDLDDMVWASRTLTITNETQLLVGLVKRQPLSVFLTAMEKIGLDPRNVYLDADVLGHWATEKDRCTAVIDVGHAHTLVTIVKDGQVHWSRAINVGGRDFTRAIRDAVGCTWDEAEALKHGTANQAENAEDTDERDGPAVSLPTEAAAFAALPEAAQTALDAPIGLLLAEVRSTLISAEDELGAEIGEARLTGGGARLGPLPDHFAEDLGIPVVPVSDPQGDVLSPEHALSEALAAVVTGKSQIKTFDLRIGDLAFRGGTDLLRLAMLYAAAATVFVMVSIVGFTGYQYWKLSSALASIDADIQTLLQANLPDADPAAYASRTQATGLLSEKLKDARTRASMLTATDVPPTVDKVYALSNAMPPSSEVVIDVSDLTITPDNISFTAETDGYSGSSAVEEALKKVEDFSQAAKGSEKKSKEKVQFTMSIPLGKPDAKETDNGG